VKLSESARALISEGCDATLITVNEDGSPQASLVWMALESTADGDELVTAHLFADYKKLRNIRREPRVAVTIVSRQTGPWFTPYLSITGEARIVEGGALERAKRLSRVMLGPDADFPPSDPPADFVTRIRVQKVVAAGL
jgi:PPOX class probable F420-dependent enzyme